MKRQGRSGPPERRGAARGPARSDRGPARSDRGPARNDRGPARSDRGPARNDRGPARGAPRRGPPPRPVAPPLPRADGPSRPALAPRPVRAPEPPPRSKQLPARGEWLWTTREGAETDLAEELQLTKLKGSARILAPAVLVTSEGPKGKDRVECTFARQAFVVEGVARGASPEELARTVLPHLLRSIHGRDRYALHVWVPDSESTNTLASDAGALGEWLRVGLASALPDAAEVDTRDVGPKAVPLLQVCLLAAGVAVAGAIPSDRAPSLAPGGRLRVHVPGDRPSRSARKVAEALTWLGVWPEPGEVCVDLGAAPGGWTFVLLERRARVIAVDPGRLRPDLAKRKGLTYLGRSAFDFEPDEPVDWLFCDMAWRPREVAELLARWARLGNASLLVANFKLPMKRKAEMVKELRSILESGGWRGVRARQLYHDRDEITVTARRN